MAVASVRVVVWEWQRDDGGYSPYYPEVIQAIENARKNGQNVLNLGTASKLLSSYKVDLVNNKQIRTGTGMIRDMRRSEICVSGTPCHGLWEWQDGSNNFNIYSVTAIMEIEEAYNLKQHFVDLSVKPSQLPYTIDFTAMNQTRHYYNTKRKIKRTTLPKPLQSYLAAPTASVSLTSASKGKKSLENSAHNRPSVAPSNGSVPGSVYNVSLPSVYPPLSGSTASSSAFSWVNSFDTESQYSPQVSTSTRGVKPNLHSATAATSARTTSRSKGESNKKASTSVPSTKSSGKAKSKSVPTNTIDLTSGSSGKSTSKSAKRCKTKVEKPATKGLLRVIYLLVYCVLFARFDICFRDALPQKSVSCEKER